MKGNKLFNSHNQTAHSPIFTITTASYKCQGRMADNHEIPISEDLRADAEVDTLARSDGAASIEVKGRLIWKTEHAGRTSSFVRVHLIDWDTRESLEGILMNTDSSNN